MQTFRVCLYRKVLAFYFLIHVVIDSYLSNIFRAATAALVEKQSHEMLELINEKRSEYMMAESLYLDGGEEHGQLEDLPPYPIHAPVPDPPALSKFQIYSDPAEFAHVDQIAISVSVV